MEPNKILIESKLKFEVSGLVAWLRWKSKRNMKSHTLEVKQSFIILFSSSKVARIFYNILSTMPDLVIDMIDA